MAPDSQGQPAMAWSLDEYFFDPMATSLQIKQPSATFNDTTQRYGETYLADTNGNVWLEQDLHNDNNVAISCAVATPEWDGGDPRIRKQWLDGMIDMIAQAGGTVQGVSNGILVGNLDNITVKPERRLQLYNLGMTGPQEPQSYALGLLVQWTDDFTAITVPTTLFEWSQELVPQPLEQKTWQSLWTNCGLDGFISIYRLRIAYQTEGSNPVQLNIAAYDNNAPQTITLPGTSGQYRKTEFVPTFNKALLFQFTASGPDNWTLIEEDSEIVVCQWGRQGICVKCPGLGGLSR
jgi:hypothetical protein